MSFVWVAIRSQEGAGNSTSSVKSIIGFLLFYADTARDNKNGIVMAQLAVASRTVLFE
jgi:hypothetical protein